MLHSIWMKKAYLDPKWHNGSNMTRTNPRWVLNFKNSWSNTKMNVVDCDDTTLFFVYNCIVMLLWQTFWMMGGAICEYLTVVRHLSLLLSFSFSLSLFLSFSALSVLHNTQQHMRPSRPSKLIHTIWKRWACWPISFHIFMTWGMSRWPFCPSNHQWTTKPTETERGRRERDLFIIFIIFDQIICGKNNNNNNKYNKPFLCSYQDHN